MLTRQEYGAIKEDLECGFYQDREEEAHMRQALREYDEYHDHCADMQAEWEMNDARFESYWESRI
jgi:hypothetical protein